MTFCVESYIGSVNGREGVKLEEKVLVTDSGVERLSNYTFQLGLIQLLRQKLSKALFKIQGN